MENVKKTVPEMVSIQCTVDIPFRFSAGRCMTKFLTELRDTGKIYGIQCPSCKRVQLPPRVVCALCDVKNNEWVELGPEGTVSAFTIIYMPITDPTTGKPRTPPLVWGNILLDGSTSPLDHYIDVEPSKENVWVGMRVKPVLRPANQRKGDLTDILHFIPIDSQSKRAEKGE